MTGKTDQERLSNKNFYQCECGFSCRYKHTLKEHQRREAVKGGQGMKGKKI